MIKAFIEGRHIWWKRPHMRTDADLDLERKASWLELFWDLIFVAVIAELSHYISNHAIEDFGGILSLILLFVPIWWIWNGITFYNERYEMDNVRHRVFMFITMLPIAGMAYSIHGAMGQLANPFAIYNIIARLLLSYMWMTACHTDLEKKLSRHFTAGLLVSSSLFTASIFVEPSYRVTLWALAIVADLASPLFSLDVQAQLPRISKSHLPERFGLLIILTLGETVINSVKVISIIKELSWLTWLISAESLLITFMIWWLYTDHVMYRVFKPGLRPALMWCYLHLPLSIAIIALSAGVSAITTTTQVSPWHSVAPGQQWQLATFVSIAIAVMVMLNIVSENHDDHHKVIEFHETDELNLILFKVYAIVFIIAFILFLHSFLSPPFLLLVIILGLLLPVLQGLHLWVKSNLQKQAL